MCWLISPGWVQLPEHNKLDREIVHQRNSSYRRNNPQPWEKTILTSLCGKCREISSKSNLIVFEHMITFSGANWLFSKNRNSVLSHRFQSIKQNLEHFLFVDLVFILSWDIKRTEHFEFFPSFLSTFMIHLIGISFFFFYSSVVTRDMDQHLQVEKFRFEDLGWSITKKKNFEFVVVRTYCRVVFVLIRDFQRCIRR